MPQMIDVRSDTVTRPTPAMLEAMLQAEVGDDVFGEDETVNELQRKAADLFGKEAALFCPTGTMSNQIGIKIHTQPGDEVICDELAHIYLYEGGGIAANSGSSVRLLQGQHGRFTAAQVRENIDRKSTRLNSSHVAISYAVVCLKKKKKLALLPPPSACDSSGRAALRARTPGWGAERVATQDAATATTAARSGSLSAPPPPPPPR